MKDFLRKLPDGDRRDFLAYSAKAFLGVGLMPAAIRSSAFAESPAMATPTAKNVIYLYMAGGMSHLDTFDPKSDRGVRGPVDSIRVGGSGIRMSEYLPDLSQRTDRLAIIRSLSSTQAHEEGRYFMHSSYTKREPFSIREWGHGLLN